MHTLSSSSHSEVQSGFWTHFVWSLTALSTQDEIYIGLSGGSSLDIFYAYLHDHLQSIDSDIQSRLRFCLLDERIVSEDHPDSNVWQLRKKFLTQLIESGSIDESQIFGVPGLPISLDPVVSVIPACAQRKYSWGTRIQSLNKNPLDYSLLVPRIDIALVGVGPDGHIASLFPHHPLLNSPLSCYLEITDSPKPPSHRITVSPLMITSAPYIFVAFMRGKEEVYTRFLDHDISITDCPVKMLTSCDHLVVMSDIDE
jgi:6-phosphogluconolactonase